MPYTATTPRQARQHLNCNDSIAWAIKLNKNQKPQKRKEVIEICKCIITDFLREESINLKNCKVLRL